MGSDEQRHLIWFRFVASNVTCVRHPSPWLNCKCSKNISTLIPRLQLFQSCGQPSLTYQFAVRYRTTSSLPDVFLDAREVPYRPLHNALLRSAKCALVSIVFLLKVPQIGFKPPPFSYSKGIRFSFRNQDPTRIDEISILYVDTSFEISMSRFESLNPWWNFGADRRRSRSARR